jgi:3-hydroxy acid dehydrogenase / malonic semialdehyde reductase
MNATLFGPGSVAVVTGASGGIGRAVVEELRARGMRVHALGLSDEHLEALSHLDEVTTYAIDLRNTPAVAELVRSFDADVLVNNAGVIGDLRPFQQYDPTVADALIDINLRGAVHATLAALPGMVERNRGHVIFTGSIAGTRPTVNTAVYSATKAALAAFADGLRMDLFGTAIRITLLTPGRVETNLYDSVFGDHDAAKAALYSGAPAIQPTDIAALVGMALSMPPNVDVTRLEVIPTGQVYGGASISTE